jgi:predicted SnoaL-like aldol condensation-catalyzing enzyme
MGGKLENVLAFYRVGVGDGHLVPAIDKYFAPNFLDQSSRLLGGSEALIAAYQPLIARYPDRLVWPVRGFEDGSRVFLHTWQSFGRGRLDFVGLEIFDTDQDDAITRRCGVRVPAATRLRSGHSQVDGPTLVDDHDRTADNKDVVAGYTADVLGRGVTSALDRYVGAGYVEHSAEGITRRPSVWYEPPTLMVGRGNFVATLGRAWVGDRRYRVVDLYRLAGLKIVEHWDGALDDDVLLVDPGPPRVCRSARPAPRRHR